MKVAQEAACGGCIEEPACGGCIEEAACGGCIEEAACVWHFFALQPVYVCMYVCMLLAEEHLEG